MSISLNTSAGMVKRKQKKGGFGVIGDYQRKKEK
jgi:hypothetical protein